VGDGRGAWGGGRKGPNECVNRTELPKGRVPNKHGDVLWLSQ
jgi:hypothetical protein